MARRVSARKSAPRGSTPIGVARSIDPMRTHADRLARPARAPGGSLPSHREGPPAGGPGAVAPGAPLSAAQLAGMQAVAGNRAAAEAVSGQRPVQRRGTAAGSAVTVQREIGWSRAEALARQLEDAMSGWGTDEEAIYGALAGRTADDMADIRDVYHQLYSKNLDAELRDELTDAEYARIRPVLEARPETTMSAGERQVAAMDRAAAIADQLHDAMEGLGTEEDQIFNALTGRTPSEIEEISRQYEARHSTPLEDDLRDDLSGDELARALRLIGREDTGTFENMMVQNMTEGARTVVRGRFDYTLHEDRLDVDVGARFVPDEGVNVPLELWNSQIDSTWNQFSISEPGGRSVEVHMSLRDDSGESRRIRVVDNAEHGRYGYPDRANAGMWYPVMPDSTAPHEFGHLIGLPDEYQRTAEDFEAITGQTKSGPENESGRTPEQIAADLHTALTGDDETQRARNATRVLREVGLISSGVPQQGDWAQEVMHAYDEAYGDETPSGLLVTLQGLPAGSNWTLLTVFSFASGTVMGNPTLVGVGEHEHPVEGRHLREFKSIVRNRWPSLDWEVS